VTAIAAGVAHEPHREPIEDMPAAPEADEVVRDADAPSWAPAPEGHHEAGPAAEPAAATLAATLAAAAASDTGMPSAAAASDTGMPSAAPGVSETGRVALQGGGAERIVAREVTVSQGGAAIIRGDQVRVEQGGAFMIIGRKVEVREGGAFIVLARRVNGQLTVAFDWRAIAAVVVGIIAIRLVRGRR
jgi:hypothetical protein